jgi:hypothetical protein
MMQLSMFQRAVLAIMGEIEDEHQAVVGYDKPRACLWVSRRSLELLLGFDWRQFHTQKMNELTFVNRIRVDRDSHGIVLYALTKKGLSTQITLGRVARSHMRFTTIYPESQVHMLEEVPENE